MASEGMKVPKNFFSTWDTQALILPGQIPKAKIWNDGGSEPQVTQNLPAVVLSDKREKFSRTVADAESEFSISFWCVPLKDAELQSKLLTLPANDPFMARLLQFLNLDRSSSLQVRTTWMGASGNWEKELRRLHSDQGYLYKCRHVHSPNNCENSNTKMPLVTWVKNHCIASKTVQLCAMVNGICENSICKPSQGQKCYNGICAKGLGCKSGTCVPCIQHPGLCYTLPN
jgi:hypothetical protein